VLQISKYPRMRIKRDLIFGFTDVLGMLVYFIHVMHVRDQASHFVIAFLENVYLFF
jgi:hypothetical protein